MKHTRIGRKGFGDAGRHVLADTHDRSDQPMSDALTIYDRWDQFMYLLSAQPRRQIISTLMDAPEQDAQPLPDAAMTPDLSVEPERFQIKLRQIHLPLLADADYVQWTEDPFQVRRGPRFDEPSSVMDVLLSADDRLAPALVAGCVEEPH